MGKHRVVHRLLACASIGDPGGEHTHAVADPEGDRLVESSPPGDTVSETIERDTRVLGEPLSDVAVGPATPVLQRLGQVPVVKRDVGGDSCFEQFVKEPIVEVDALLVDGADAVGQQARPAQ